jgi:tetratricopeptide (TPR) repeat protein
MGAGDNVKLAQDARELIQSPSGTVGMKSFLSVGMVVSKSLKTVAYHYASLSEVIDLDSILVSRGRVKIALGDQVGGMADLDRAIKISDGVGSYYRRGIARRDAGDKPGAISDFQVALAEARESSFPKKT